MPNRNDYDPTHPRSDGDRNKIAILWDQRHDCDQSIAAIYDRIRELEKEMTKAQVLRESGARTTAVISSLSTGLVVGLFVWFLNHFGK